jgi:uncharacterized membrane protein YeaQ/YmgE (transglycosylase-associated protein family)
LSRIIFNGIYKMLILTFCWMIIGVLAGFLASKVITGHGQGFVMDMVVGVGGALIGGLLSRSFGATRLNVWALLARLLPFLRRHAARLK